MIEQRIIGHTVLRIHEDLDIFLEEAQRYKPSLVLNYVQDATRREYELIAEFVANECDARIYLSPEPIDAASLSEPRSKLENAGKRCESNILEGRVEVAGNGAILEIFENKNPNRST